jgi:hypothetical protein
LPESSNKLATTGAFLPPMVTGGMAEINIGLGIVKGKMSSKVQHKYS